MLSYSLPAQNAVKGMRSHALLWNNTMFTNDTSLKTKRLSVKVNSTFIILQQIMSNSVFHSSSKTISFRRISSARSRRSSRMCCMRSLISSTLWAPALNASFVNRRADCRAVLNASFVNRRADCRAVLNASFVSNRRADCRAVLNASFVSNRRADCRAVLNASFVSNRRADCRAVLNASFVSNRRADCHAVLNASFVNRRAIILNVRLKTQHAIIRNIITTYNANVTTHNSSSITIRFGFISLARAFIDNIA